MIQRTVEIPDRMDLQSTVRGAKLPVMIGPNGSMWSTRTPDGTGSIYLNRIGSSRSVEGRAWGDGAAWLLEQMPGLVGLRDDLDRFEETVAELGGPLAKTWRQKPFRLNRTDRPWDALVGAILGQKVQVTRAVESRRLIARHFGDIAPGPEIDGRRRAAVLPAPEVLGQLGYADLHRCGVERKRAEILIRSAREMRRLDDLWSQNPKLIRQRLEKIRGVGPWTSNLVTAVAFGDPDAVPVGDFHIPNIVAWHMAGEDRATDDRMLELLEPYRGDRWRVIRLAKGKGSAPRYGARLSLISDGMVRGK